MLKLKSKPATTKPTTQHDEQSLFDSSNFPVDGRVSSCLNSEVDGTLETCQEWEDGKVTCGNEGEIGGNECGSEGSEGETTLRGAPGVPFAVVPAGEGEAGEGKAAKVDASPSFVVALDPPPCPALVDFIARHGVDALADLGEAKHPTTGQWLSVHTLVVDAIVRFESVSSVSRGKAREKWALACEVFEGATGWRSANVDGGVNFWPNAH